MADAARSRPASADRALPGPVPADFLPAAVRAPALAVLLDYDGTLAPFHPDPDQARPYPGAAAAVHALMDAGVTVGIVSGRWLKPLLPLLDMDPCPQLWGCHGRERRGADGAHRFAPLDGLAGAALAQADAWVPDLERLGARVERKPASLAVHWRGVPQAREAIVALVRERVRLDPAMQALAWLDFDHGVELRAPGVDKGHAVRTTRDELGPGARVVYAGDDHTDEDAFAALADGDLGVLVGAAPRPSRAQAWLSAPDGLLGFLHDLARARRSAP